MCYHQGKIGIDRLDSDHNKSGSIGDSQTVTFFPARFHLGTTGETVDSCSTLTCGQLLLL